MKLNQIPHRFFIFVLCWQLTFFVANLKTIEARPGSGADDEWNCSPSNYHRVTVCKVMAPRNGSAPPQDPSTSPWKIYTWKPKIQQFFTHPVVLGSDTGEELFSNYILVARAVKGGRIVGHFEHQWDATPVCCYEPGKNYSYEGRKLHPNLLYGSRARILKANQTVLWTSPKNFEGQIVFMATFSVSSQVYWPNVTSAPVEVVKRNEELYPFNRERSKDDLVSG